ncbi:hypothetical protein Tco_1442913 [Tanacetum coccineum]
MIPTTISPTTPTIDLLVIHDDTLLTPTISPTIPTIPPVAPTIQYTSPFMDTNSSNCDTPDSPPSQDPYETVVAWWRSRPIPIGRPYRTQPDGGTYDVDYQEEYSPDDSSTTASARPSCKRCRSPTSSVPAVFPICEALSPVRTDLSPLPKRIRDSNKDQKHLIRGSWLIKETKDKHYTSFTKIVRLTDLDLVTDLEVSLEEGYEPYVPREVGFRVDFEDSYEPYTEPDIDSNIQANIDECIMYVDAIRAKGIDDRDVVKTATEEEVESRERDMVKVGVNPKVRPVVHYDVHESVRKDASDHDIADGAVEVTYETLGDLVQRFHDHVVEILVHRIQVIESEQRLQGHRITRVDLEVTTMTKRNIKLERDNTRLRGMLDVENQRVDRLQCGLSRAQRELRQMRHF